MTDRIWWWVSGDDQPLQYRIFLIFLLALSLSCANPEGNLVNGMKAAALR